MAGGFGLDRPQPLTGGEYFKEYMSGVGGVQHDLPCTPQCPGGMQVLEGRQVAADHLFSIADDTLQSAPVFDGSSSVPDGDGGGEDGLYDGGVEVHHHGLWQVELFQLPQEVHPLLCLFGDAADVLLPLEVLADDCAQEAEGLHGDDWGVTQGDGGGWGCVPPEVHNHLHCL